MRREDPQSISFPCMRVRQPVGEFYVGVIKWRDLAKICTFDIRRVIQKERDVERYLGIQRPLDEKRIVELGKYVNTIDACFPTAVIIRVDARCVSVNEFDNVMTLSNYYEKNEGEILFKHIARVIDGQHRIAGLDEFKYEEFDVETTILIDFDLAAQAQIFSIVNLTQTKVRKSLAYDLFELATHRSPQKTCHDITVALDSEKNSPLYKKIKRLGVSTDGRFGETLTQQTVVEPLIKYISKDPIVDRDTIMRGKRMIHANAEELGIYIFRNMFIDDKDLDILNNIWNLFEAVRRRWPDAWGASGTGAMLNRTNGFRAIMRFLRPAYLHFTSPGGVVSVDKFSSLLARVELGDEDFDTRRFLPGSSGETELYWAFIKDTGVRTKG